jgi:uncharacterized iron-regulated membrane protein
MPRSTAAATASAVLPGREPSSSRRRLWFDLHSWVGLKLSVLMLFVCATGTLAVLAHEIDWLLHAPIRVQPQESEPASWGSWLAAVQRAHPTWRVQSLQAPIDPWFAAKAWVVTEEGRNRFVWVNPHTAQVTGDTAWFNAHRLLRNTHRHLMMPIQLGLTIVCLLAVALLVTFASSFVIYKRWWRGFFTWPRRERTRRFWGDLHRLLGLWSLWFVLLIALTGVWYLLEQWGFEAPALAAVDRRAGEPPAAPPAVVHLEAARVDQLVSEARKRWPGFKVESIWPPQTPQAALMLQGQAGAWLVRERANAIAFDPATGAMLGARDAAKLGLHQRLAEMADPLHFGTWGGLPSKLVWFFAGLLMTALAATGVWLYGLRVTGGTAAFQGIACAAWRGFGGLRFLWLLLLAVWLLLIPAEASR